MHARMHVSGRGGSKLCRFCWQKARPPEPHYVGRSIHDRLGSIVIVLRDNTRRPLLVAQYDSIYRVTARAQDVPVTRPDDSEGSGTHAQVLGVQTWNWQLALC